MWCPGDDPVGEALGQLYEYIGGDENPFSQRFMALLWALPSLRFPDDLHNHFKSGPLRLNGAPWIDGDVLEVSPAAMPPPGVPPSSAPPVALTPAMLHLAPATALILNTQFMRKALFELARIKGAGWFSTCWQVRPLAAAEPDVLCALQPVPRARELMRARYVNSEQLELEANREALKLMLNVCDPQGDRTWMGRIVPCDSTGAAPSAPVTPPSPLPLIGFVRTNSDYDAHSNQSAINPPLRWRLEALVPLGIAAEDDEFVSELMCDLVYLEERVRQAPVSLLLDDFSVRLAAAAAVQPETVVLL